MKKRRYFILILIVLLCLILPATAVVNGKIAFVSNRDGNPEIYVMNPDGTGQTRLTDNQFNDTAPTWSPDGTKIAFMSDRDGNSEIYIMNPDGSGQTRLTNNQVFDGWISDGTAWSPEGKKIRFISDREYPTGIYAMNPDGTGQIRITQVFWDHIWNHPILSPYSNKIGYVITYPNPDEPHDADSYLFVMNVDETGRIVLKYSNYYFFTEPKWSPDGKKIAFLQIQGSPLRYYVYVINADGTALKEIQGYSFTPFSDLTWSPDSTKIAYTTVLWGPPYGQLISVSNVDGSLPAASVGVSCPEPDRQEEKSPAWSPDGKRIAFVSNLDGNEEIYVDGCTRLTNSQGSDNSPAWGSSPATSSITVKLPNGGETWQRGTDHTITWRYTGDPGQYVKLVLLKAGTEVGTINSSVSIGTGGTGSCVWSIWSGRAIGSDYTVSVQSISQPTIKDTSDNYFTISSTGTTTPSITVISPNGGESWKRGTTQTVKWSYMGNPGPYVKVELLQGGVAVGTATYSTSIGTSGTGSYPWAISSTRAPGTNYRIRVTSVSQPTISDTSNGDFTITL